MNHGIPERFPQPRQRLPLGRPANWVWPVLAVAAVGGAALSLVLGARPWPTAGTYLATIAVVIGCFGVSTVNLRMTGRMSPQLMFIAAIFSYTFTIAVLSFVWLVSSPRVVVGPAVLAGATVAVVVWVGGVVHAAWVR